MQRIRTLTPGEPVPEGEPRRYPDRAGYVRLRWRVGPGEQVEIREHRLVAGVVTDDHVHHKNHVTGDNRPDNLAILTADEHAALHGGKARKFDRHRAAHLYAAGLSTVELGRVFGVNPVTVYRGLRAEGVKTRPVGAWVRHDVDEPRVLALHDAGWKAATIGRHLGVGREVIARVLRRNGRTPHGPGTPSKGFRAI